MRTCDADAVIKDRYGNQLTYGPRKAVAEVSNHNEPIGRKSGIQIGSKDSKVNGLHIQLFCFELIN